MIIHRGATIWYPRWLVLLKPGSEAKKKWKSSQRNRRRRRQLRRRLQRKTSWCCFFLLSEVIQTAAPVQGCCVLFLLLFSVALEVCDVQQIVLVLIFCQTLFGKLGTTPPGSHGRDFSLSALRHKVFSSFPGNRSPSAKFSLLVLTFYNFFAIKFHFHLF